MSLLPEQPNPYRPENRPVAMPDMEFSKPQTRPPEWEYSHYRATLMRNGQPWAILSPNGKDSLTGDDAKMLVDKLNARPPRKVDYGDFTEYEIRCLIAEYCNGITLGTIGWGVPFKTWVELLNIATHEGHFKLKRIKRPTPEELGLVKIEQPYEIQQDGKVWYVRTWITGGGAVGGFHIPRLEVEQQLEENLGPGQLVELEGVWYWQKIPNAT